LSFIHHIYFDYKKDRLVCKEWKRDVSALGRSKIVIQTSDVWIQDREKIPFSTDIQTLLGDLILRRFCTPECIQGLKTDSGLCAFARLPEREHQLLVEIARHPESMLTVAYNDEGEIVGEVTLAPADEWWQLPQQQVRVYEVGLDVSYRWRRLGIARQLLAFALDLDALEDMIVLGMGLRWHWDTERTGVPPMRYRELLARVVAPYGFSEYMTLEANIASEPTNILLVRIGQRVDEISVNDFVSRVLRVESIM